MHVLIIRPGALGDTLMALPAMKSLPCDHRVTLAGRMPGAAYLRDHAELVVDMEVGGWHRLFMERPDPRGVGQAQAQCVVACVGDADGRVLRNCRAYFPHARVHVVPSLPPPGVEVHAAFHVARCLEEAGLPVEPSRCVDAACARGLLELPSRIRSPGQIVVHPGSGDHRKNYPADAVREVVASVLREPSMRDAVVRVLLGPAEEHSIDEWKSTAAAWGGEAIVNPEPPRLLSLLRGCGLYIGHDSGTTHLAAMCGARTIVMFRASDPVQWRPLGPAVRVIEACASTGTLAGRVREAVLDGV